MTKHLKSLFDTAKFDTLLIISSGSLNKNHHWLSWVRTARILRLSLVMKTVMRIFTEQPARSLSRAGILSEMRLYSSFAPVCLMTVRVLWAR